MQEIYLSKKLKYLNCAYNELTILNNMSNSLQQLICNNNKIIEINHFSINLHEISII
jgi:Leucine-rich repeat (LRR) protein